MNKKKLCNLIIIFAFLIFIKSNLLSQTTTLNCSWGQIYLGKHFVRGQANPDLMIHFHGKGYESATFTKLDSAGLGCAMIFISTSSYSSLFSSNPRSRFESLINEILAVLKSGSYISVNAQWRKIGLSSWSAGYASIREILKDSQNYQKICFIALADSLYAGLQTTNPRVIAPNDFNMKDYKQFAIDASSGNKTFVVSHSTFLPTYAGTVETAEYLITAVGGQRIYLNPPQNIPPATDLPPSYSNPMTLYSTYDKTNFHVRGYYNVSVSYHLDHLLNIDRLYVYFSSTTSTQVPQSPTNLASIVISSTQANISWQDNSTTESGFKIERKLEGGSYSLLATVNVNVTSYNNTGLSPGTTYYYRVYAYNSGGNSSYSNEVKIITLPVQVSVPIAPNNLFGIELSSGQVSINWQDNSNNESGFRIERKLESGSYILLTTINANTTSYTDLGLSPGATYYYRVYSWNNAGNSGYSNEIKIVTIIPEQFLIPAIPSNLDSVEVSPNQVTLRWEDNADNETGFKIERKLEDENYSLLTTVNANMNSYTDIGLSPGTTCYYRVYAYNTDGDSGYSNELTVVTPREQITYPSTVEAIIGIHGGEVVLADGNFNDGETKIEFPGGSVEDETKIRIIRREVYTIPQAINNELIDGNYIFPVAAYEIISSGSNQFTQPITINLLYPDLNNDGMVDNTGYQELKLQIFWYDLINSQWRHLGGILNTGNNTVYAKVDHLTLYGIFPVKSGGLNAWDYTPKEKIITPNQDGQNDYAYFNGIQNYYTSLSLSGNTDFGGSMAVKIYDLSGRLIKKLSDSDTWDGKNDDGNPVETGIYIYQYTAESQMVSGTIVLMK